MIKLKHLVAALVACGGLLPGPLASQTFDEIVEMANQGRTEKALREIDGLVRRAPTNFKAHFLRGVLLAELDRTVEAEQAFVRLTGTCPGSPEIFNNLAVIQAFSGRYATAVVALKELGARHPDYELGRKNLESVRLRKAAAYDPLRDNAAPIGLILAAEMAECKPAAQVPPAAPKASPPAAPLPAADADDTQDADNADSTEVAAQDSALVRDQIVDTVTAWALAWDEQRVDDYLGFYGKHFVPPSKLKRDAWEAIRRPRVTNPTFIDIEVADLTIDENRPGPTLAKFTQKYRSSSYQDTVKKTLSLALEDGEWKIVLEEVEP